nr:hypothetical protein [uncultured archaeon]
MLIPEWGLLLQIKAKTILDLFKNHNVRAVFILKLISSYIYDII